ncbi:photosynthetic protein synthase I [Chitiniphilus shinanonensis]|uniref:Photosynthetic protein synthase I n=1 Tax=Chitiniphilus shinanonensis TaxID=553088 RepID=A0ABQ6BSB6_9NEIS|nr:SCO family protein [Chitiniphilus shinanonensis]GLS04514.1 photosynthetic protein synthase I [Chitiniphilus shinanonensis]
MIRRLFCLMVLALLAACSRPAFQGSDLTGASFGGDFQLVDHTGKARLLSDYRGKVVALFFGYTHCPDVCPTTMAELSAAMKKLGDKAGEVQVLFVSVDPERDTPQLLAQYVPAFDKRFVGLTGTPQQVSAATERYKVIYQRQNVADGYTVDHTAGTYLIDRKGRLRVLENYGAGPEVFAHDLALLIEE